MQGASPQVSGQAVVHKGFPAQQVAHSTASPQVSGQVAAHAIRLTSVHSWQSGLRAHQEQRMRTVQLLAVIVLANT